jgi:hypothetical protein
VSPGASRPKRERSARGARQTRARAGARSASAGRSGTRESSQGAGDRARKQSGGKHSPGGAKQSAGSATVSRGPASARKQQRASSSSRRARAAVELAPRQGFESEGERPSGPVQPPGGAELVASAAEIVGEITKAGFAAGERLLRDVLSRLPGS